MRKLIRTSEAANLLGVSASTLRRWEKKGLITPYRLPVKRLGGGERRYDLEEILKLQKG